MTRHARVISHESVLAAQVKRRSIDVVQRTTTSVRFGALHSIEIKVPAAIADRWELLDKEIADKEELGRDADGARRFRLSFDRPVLDKVALRIRYRVPIVPGLEATTAREVSIPWVSVDGASAPAPTIELTLSPEIVVSGTSPRWVRSLHEPRSELAAEGATVEFVCEAATGPAPPFTLQLQALELLPLPPLLVPRLLVKSVLGGDDTVTSSAYLWVESHGLDMSFSLPAGARWLGAKVDGRVAAQVEFDPPRKGYRLVFPGDVGAKPVLVELEYQAEARGQAATWQSPRLLGGGVVLQSLWEVRLPWNLALLGVPAGWVDENEWYWDGRVWKRRAWKDSASVHDWLSSSSASPAAFADLDATQMDVSDRYLFSRSGEPGAMQPWIVPHAWLVAIFSGSVLLVGFFVIFGKLRVRTLWLALAALGLLGSALVQPSVAFLAIQSALLGVVLTLLGLVMERLIERSRRAPARDGSALVARGPAADSSLDRAAGVGSDDPTAIRVRVPSTLDFVPAAAASAAPLEEPSRGSAVER